MRGSKVRSLAGLKEIRAKLRRKGKKVVFTNGCFDLIHGGHIALFKKARACGDVLIVGLNTDASVRKIKGPSRPVFPLKERFEILSAIMHIDYLTSFSEETPQRIIAALLPDVLVKGGDWGSHEIIGKNDVEAAGGKVVRIPYLKGHSSSRIIEKILKNFS